MKAFHKSFLVTLSWFLILIVMLAINPQWFVYTIAGGATVAMFLFVWAVVHDMFYR